MTYDNAEFIGKTVKDIYGSYMGKVAGTTTEIDGSIQSVGVDCGSAGLRMIPGEHLVIQGDVVIFIPKWRLDSQRLLREKQLVLRRLRAMIEIVAGNDEMRADAEIVQERYRTKLASLQKAADDLKSTLDSRLAELEDQSRSAKMLFFDAKIQYKSNEIEADVFETARRSTNDLIEHVSHEIAEISNIQERIRGLEAEVDEVTELTSSSISSRAGSKEAPAIYAHNSAAAQQDPQPMPPEALAGKPAGAPTDEMTTTMPGNPAAPATPQAAVARSTPAPTQTGAPPGAPQGSTKQVAAAAATATTTGGAKPSFQTKPQEFAMSDAASDTTDAVQPKDATQAKAQVAHSGAATAPASTGAADAAPAMQGGAAAAAATGSAGTDAAAQKDQVQKAPGSGEMGSSIPMVMPTPAEPGRMQHGSHSGEPPHDEDVVFPEPPKNSASPTGSKPKSDDDWLSRMASQ